MIGAIIASHVFIGHRRVVLLEILIPVAPADNKHLGCHGEGWHGARRAAGQDDVTQTGSGLVAVMAAATGLVGNFDGGNETHVAGVTEHQSCKQGKRHFQTKSRNTLCVATSGVFHL